LTGWPSRESVQFINKLYSEFVFAVMDEGHVRSWGFHTPKPLTVRDMPSWGTRYGTTWTGPRFFNYWLIELNQEGLLSPADMNKIGTAMMLWNNGQGQEHLKEYYDDEIKKDLQKRLTTLFKMMAWAHRDYGKWEEVQQYLATWPAHERDVFGGPVLHELWNGDKIIGMNFLQANLK
jgi:hypothetical protein